MKMKEDKKPVNTVFITESQKYNEGLNSHATSVGDSVINTTCTIG